MHVPRVSGDGRPSDSGGRRPIAAPGPSTRWVRQSLCAIATAIFRTVLPVHLRRRCTCYAGPRCLSCVMSRFCVLEADLPRAAFVAFPAASFAGQCTIHHTGGHAQRGARAAPSSQQLWERIAPTSRHFQSLAHGGGGGVGDLDLCVEPRLRGLCFGQDA